MINSTPPPADQPEDDAVEAIVASGAGGAVVLASIATAIVIGLWIAFYLFVFSPRGPAS